MRLLTVGLLLAPMAQAATDDLMSIYTDALASNPALQSAQAALEAARFDVEAAQSGLRPTVSAAADVSAGETLRSNSAARPETSSSSVSGALTARLALWGPAEKAGIASAQAGALLTETQAEATLSQLQIGIAQDYLAVLNAEAQLAAAQAQAQAVERQLERANKRLEVGLGTRVEVDQTQAAFDNTQVALIRAQDALADALDKLSTSADRDVSSLARLSANYPATPSDLALNEVVEQAQLNSTQVKLSTQQVNLARAAIYNARAGAQPRLDASANYSTDKNLKGGLWGEGYSGKLTLSMPIYTAGRVDAQIASATAKLAQAQADLDDARRSVAQQARSLYRAIASQASTVSAQAQSIRSAETAVEATQAAFDVGSGTIIDVLNAQSDLNAAQSQFAQARHQHALLVLQLEQLRGDLNQDDLDRLNRQLVR